jgi:hypothetical protein
MPRSIRPPFQGLRRARHEPELRARYLQHQVHGRGLSLPARRGLSISREAYNGVRPLAPGVWCSSITRPVTTTPDSILSPSTSTGSGPEVGYRLNPGIDLSGLHASGRLPRVEVAGTHRRRTRRAVQIGELLRLPLRRRRLRILG